MALRQWILVLVLPTFVMSLPGNPYSGANTLFSSAAWAKNMAEAADYYTPIAAHPPIKSLASTISTYHDSSWLSSYNVLYAIADTNVIAGVLAAAGNKPSPVTVTFVTFYIPNRACPPSAGSFGGASSLTAYQSYLNSILASFKAHPTVRISVIIEPGALANYVTSRCSFAAGYPVALQMAINTLSGSSNVAIYLDIGDSGWTGYYVTATAAAINTVLAGVTSIANFRGFSTNIGNYNTMAMEYSFITAMNTALAPYGHNDMRFVVDTSRNGVELRRSAGEWCNILGASLGLAPQATPVGYPLLDALLWIKPPSLSDGASPPTWSTPVRYSCTGPNSAPNAPPGLNVFKSYVAMLLQNAITNSAGPMAGFDVPTPLSSVNPFQGAALYSSADWAAMIATAKSASNLADSPSMMELTRMLATYGDVTWITSMTMIGKMDRVLAASNIFISSTVSSTTTVTFVINHVPNLGCTVGGGAVTLAAYQSFLNMIANEAMTYPAVRVVFIIEPGVIVSIVTDACPANNNLYTSALQAAIITLSVPSNVAIYIDIGSSSRVPSSAIPQVASLISTIVSRSLSVRGLITNVGGYNTLPVEYSFITLVHTALLTKNNLSRLQFIVDTSRNGIDTGSVSGEWCNLNGSSLGIPPASNPIGYSLLDATLYVKTIGQSDGYSPASVTSPIPGTCSGPNSIIDAPNEGMWFQTYYELLLINTIIAQTGPLVPTVRPTMAPTPSPETNAPAVSSTLTHQEIISPASTSLPLPMLLITIGVPIMFVIFIGVMLERRRRQPKAKPREHVVLEDPTVARNIAIRMAKEQAKQEGRVLTTPELAALMKAPVVKKTAAIFKAPAAKPTEMAFTAQIARQ